MDVSAFKFLYFTSLHYSHHLLNFRGTPTDDPETSLWSHRVAKDSALISSPNQPALLASLPYLPTGSPRRLRDVSCDRSRRLGTNIIFFNLPAYFTYITFSTSDWHRPTAPRHVSGVIAWTINIFLNNLNLQAYINHITFLTPGRLGHTPPRHVDGVIAWTINPVNYLYFTSLHYSHYLLNFPATSTDPETLSIVSSREQ